MNFEISTGKKRPDAKYAVEKANMDSRYYKDALDKKTAHIDRLESLITEFNNSSSASQFIDVTGVGSGEEGRILNN